jgi:hypothetical protein
MVGGVTGAPHVKIGFSVFVFVFMIIITHFLKPAALPAQRKGIFD